MIKPGARLVKSFRTAGKDFAYSLRVNLPKVTFLSQGKAALARQTLQRAAAEASAALRHASSEYLRSRAIEEAVALGQRRAAAQLGVEFGGINMRLVGALRRSLAQDLARASNSQNQFVNESLRKATIIGKQLESSIKVIRAADEKMTRSLLTGTLTEETYHLASKRLLKDLGLEEGDKAIFLSGYRMDAEAYAKLVVRTRTMEALNQGRASEYVDQGYKFIETTEHEGVDERDICYFLQGKVWALAPNEEGIPLLPEEYGLPPWHPNCAHTFAAWQPEFEGGSKAVDKVVSSHDDDKEALDAWDGKSYQSKAEA